MDLATDALRRQDDRGSADGLYQQDRSLLSREPRARVIEFVTIVLPCLNEEAAVAATVGEGLAGLAGAGVPGEVLVVDNGSTDRSIERAQAAGARVICEGRRGYGAALSAGIAAARGNVVVMADADQTYDLPEVGKLLEPLRRGADIVVGSRLLGGIAHDAMPLLHRYVGTPVITRVLRVLTGLGLSDSQSGYRAFWRDAVLALQLRASGMEFASEMLLRAGRAGQLVVEVPSGYRARVGESKLNTLSDGWRHIHMLLILSPHLSLILPGIISVLLGLLLSCVSLLAPSGIVVGSTHWLPVYLNPILLIVGAQALLLGSLAAYRSPLTPVALRTRLRWLARPSAVNELLGCFGICMLVGLAIDSVLLLLWVAHRSGPALLGMAGIAQALIVIGACGIATLFATEYAREHRGW